MALPHARGEAGPVGRVTEARHPGPDPQDLALAQVEGSRYWLQQARSGAGLRWHWRALHETLGHIMPGWLVAVGARPKCGKTTLLLSQALSWVTAGRKVAYLGSETGPDVTRLQCAALVKGFNVGEAIQGELPVALERLLVEEADRQATEWGHMLLMPDQMGSPTLADLLYWLDWAHDHGAEVVMFDHLQRIAHQPGARFEGADNAVRALQTRAQNHGMVILLAAQFNRGEGKDPLSYHEVPSDNAWRDTDAITQDAVVTLQLFKPFKPGVTSSMKRAFREGQPLKDGGAILTLSDLVQDGVMALRVGQHRYKPKHIGTIVKLSVNGDCIEDMP